MVDKLKKSTSAFSLGRYPLEGRADYKKRHFAELTQMFDFGPPRVIDLRRRVGQERLLTSGLYDDFRRWLECGCEASAVYSESDDPKAPPEKRLVLTFLIRGDIPQRFEPLFEKPQTEPT